jgi:hypothetical protein
MEFEDFQKKLRKDLMPSGDELANFAQQRFKIEREKIKKNFNTYLRGLLSLEFQIYKEHERNCSAKIIKQAIGKGFLKEAGCFSESLKQNYSQLWSFFLSISQSRKARAGGSFEKHVRYLFELLDYPFERQAILDGKVNYVIPSKDAFGKNRTACVVISIKRTLRERWREVIGELSSTNAGKIYILTADENISYPKVEEMNAHNITLVVWDEYKRRKFRNYYNVIGFTDFINEDLPSSQKLWERLL